MRKAICSVLALLVILVGGAKAQEPDYRFFVKPPSDSYAGIYVEVVWKFQNFPNDLATALDKSDELLESVRRKLTALPLPEDTRGHQIWNPPNEAGQRKPSVEFYYLNGEKQKELRLEATSSTEAPLHMDEQVRQLSYGKLSFSWKESELLVSDAKWNGVPFGSGERAETFEISRSYTFEKFANAWTERNRNFFFRNVHSQGFTSKTGVKEELSASAGVRLLILAGPGRSEPVQGPWGTMNHVFTGPRTPEAVQEVIAYVGKASWPRILTTESRGPRASTDDPEEWQTHRVVLLKYEQSAKGENYSALEKEAEGTDFRVAIYGGAYRLEMKDPKSFYSTMSKEILAKAKEWSGYEFPAIRVDIRDGRMKTVGFLCEAYWKNPQQKTMMHLVAEQFAEKPVTKENIRKLSIKMKGALFVEFIEQAH